jgi:hypothetical protein
VITKTTGGLSVGRAASAAGTRTSKAQPRSLIARASLRPTSSDADRSKRVVMSAARVRGGIDSGAVRKDCTFQ